MTDITEFRGVFIRSGWRGIERTYGHSSSVLMQLIAKAGGPELLAERRKVQGCGRKAGGNARNSAQEARTEAKAGSEVVDDLNHPERAHGAFEGEDA